MPAQQSQMTQSNSSTVVTCKETSSSPHATLSTAGHLQNRSVQADRVDVDRLMCRAVSVADAAVEVGESLLAADSERPNGGIAPTSSAIPLPSVTAVYMQSSPTCTDTDAAAAAALHQSPLCEPLPGAAVTFRSVFCHHQPKNTSTLKQCPDRENSANYHISPPAIVIVPDESTSQGYQLSCDEHSSGENNAEVSGPLDNLAQQETFEPAESAVCYPVTC